MMQLGTIGQAIYMRLFFHFANLYDGRRGKSLSFEKRYDDICNEWLGGLTILKHKSKIIGEQLGQHLDQLVQAGFLSSHGIKKAKSGEGFVLSFRPGPAFFEDYERFYRRRHQAELQWEFHEDRRKISEPLKVAFLFSEKRTGRSVDATGFVPTKDMENAKLFLATLGFDEMPSFLDFALAEAKKTNFDVQTLGGIKQYLPGYLAFQEQRAANKAAEDARKLREREDARRAAHDHFRRRAAKDIFDGLPEQEKAVIDSLAQTYAATFGGALRGTMAEVGRIRFTIERHGARLKTFEQWQIETAPALCGF